MAGLFFHLFGADYLVPPSVPPAPMDQVFGARHKRREYPERLELGGLPGERVVETYTLHGAQVLAVWEEDTILTHHRFGAGQAVLCGSFVGAAYPEGEPDRVRKFVHRLCRLGGIAPEAGASGECLVRIAHSGRSTVAFVFNLSDQPAQCDVTIPNAGQLARDLMSGRELRRSSGGSFQVELGPKGSSILLIEGA